MYVFIAIRLLYLSTLAIFRTNKSTPGGSLIRYWWASNLLLFNHTRAQGRRKPKPGLLHHSDRGSQYASHEYRKHLAIMKMAQRSFAPEGMSRKGNCWDNSPTERFFRSLKHEQLNYERFRTKASAKLSIMDYLAF
jgi:transposase InsO family protein